MRVSLRARQTAAVTLLIALAMTALSVQHLANLARVGLEDSRGIGDLHRPHDLPARARGHCRRRRSRVCRFVRIRASDRSSSRPPHTAAQSPTRQSSTTRAARSPTASPPPRDRKSRQEKIWRPCSMAACARRSAPFTPIARSRSCCRWSSAMRRSARFGSACRRC